MTKTKQTQAVLAGRRITEAEIADVIVEILQSMKGGRATIGTLVAAILRRLALSLADMVRSRSRPDEQVWEQQVRNVVAHRNIPGNAIFEGRLRKVNGGLALPRNTGKE